MRKEDLLAKVADVVLASSLKFEVDVKPKSWIHSKLQHYRLRKKKKVFEIHPITLGSLVRISKLLLSIDVTLSDLREKWLETSYQAMSNHAETVATVVAIAIHNQKSEPSKAMVDFVLDNFSSKETMGVLSVVVKQMDIGSFMSSIISIKGMTVLEKDPAVVKSAKNEEVSPSSQKEIIAPGI
jgi:hypothetical protein